MRWVDEGHCIGQFSCGNNTCVDLSKVCDQNKDCPNGKDENLCRKYKHICCCWKRKKLRYCTLASVLFFADN